MTQSPKAPVPRAFKPPELLEFISSYSQSRPLGRRYNLSMAGSVVLHMVALYTLALNPHWLVVIPGLRAPAEQSAESGEGSQYRMVTYVPISNQPMVAPYRMPVGDLYSAQNTLAISRPPQPRPGGNLQPFSRGTTKEPLITDVVKELESRPAGEPTAENDKVQVVEAETPPEKVRAGSPPQLPLPPAERIPSATAMILPPPPEEVKERIGDPGATNEAGELAARVQRDAQSRLRVAEDVARQLKLADEGQRIFDNEDSALRSEGSGFFDTKGFELSGYSQFVVDRIKANWLIPQGARQESGRSTIIFYIEKDGQISGLRVVTPSGRVQLDRAALNSILGASPFPPLPRNFTGEHIGAKLIFSYNEVRTP